jgi:hypothetical protein
MPEFYFWLLVAVIGTVFQQSSFRAGALTASLPAMTVAEPLVASLLGVTVLGETIGADGPEPIGLVAAVVVVIVATTALARGEAATMVSGAGEKLPTSREPIAAIRPDLLVAPEAFDDGSPSHRSDMDRLSRC